MGMECCSTTLKAWVAGSWSRDDLPSEKHGTQRSYSWQVSSLAQRMRTWARQHGMSWQSVWQHTVEVMSDEHTSQTYLMPPSVPRVPVFFLMTPMMSPSARSGQR